MLSAAFDSQVGQTGGEKPAIIRLSGNNIIEEHCFFDNIGGRVTLTASEGSITV